MNKKNFEMYAHLNMQKKKLEEEMEQLKPQIIDDMRESETDEVEAEYGKFTLSERRKWQYPEYVTDLEKQLKEKQKEAKQIGDAESEVTTVLAFYPAK